MLRADVCVAVNPAAVFREVTDICLVLIIEEISAEVTCCEVLILEGTAVPSSSIEESEDVRDAVVNIIACCRGRCANRVSFRHY